MKQTFSALVVPNYRRWFFGQCTSNIGTWMQTVAQGLLVLQLSGSGTALGLVIGLQTLPVLLLGPYGGLVADRVDKRREMMVLQSMMGLLALALGLLTTTGTVELWHVYVLAALLGLNNAFENPVRQAFVLEMVGPEHLRNAVSLNSVIINAARAVGPAIAALIIATEGIGVCFLVNAGTFVAVVYSLWSMDVATLSPSPPASRDRGQLVAGFRYVRRTPALAIPLLMMGTVGMLTYEFPVVLPVLARDVFGGDEATTYSLMTTSMGIGAVVGALLVARLGRTGLGPLSTAAAGFGALMAVTAVAPTKAVALVALALVGATSVSFLAIGNSTLQLSSDPQMRGRVMSLWSVAFLGSTPIGGPIVGFVSDHAGARWALALGALSALLAAVLGWCAKRTPTTHVTRSEHRHVQPVDEPMPADAV